MSPLMNAYRAVLMLVVAIPVPSLLSWSALAAEQKDASSKVTEIRNEPPQTRWELLDFFIPSKNPQSLRIRRIRVTLPEKVSTPWRSGWTGDKPLIYETTDPKVLEAIEEFLWMPLRLAVVPGLHGARGDGSSSSLGTILVVKENADEFLIHVSRVGFVLESDSADYQNTFYSWGLAQFLDDVTFERLKIHIPDTIMKGLTGESRMDADRRVMSALRQANRGTKK